MTKKKSQSGYKGKMYFINHTTNTLETETGILYTQNLELMPFWQILWQPTILANQFLSQMHVRTKSLMNLY